MMPCPLDIICQAAGCGGFVRQLAVSCQLVEVGDCNRAVTDVTQIRACCDGQRWLFWKQPAPEDQNVTAWGVTV